MHIVITGANGFIGRHLLTTLLSETQLARHAALRITAVDLQLDQIPEHTVLQKVTGSCADPELLQTILQVPADLVFHLAAVPSGLAEEQPLLGMDVNVHGMILMLESLKTQRNCPTPIFASSIAVYGKPQVPVVTEDTTPTPTLSYGAHNVIGEVLVNNYIRRGWIQERQRTGLAGGRCARLAARKQRRSEKKSRAPYTPGFEMVQGLSRVL